MIIGLIVGFLFPNIATGLETLSAIFIRLVKTIIIPIIFAFILLPTALLFKVPIKKFIGAVKEPVIIAFSTTSSEAALPKAMQAMESIGVPRNIVAFVILTGYSFNLDGTTLYLFLASIFVAQAVGVDLSMGQQLLMGFTLVFASKGAAGIPRASLTVLQAPWRPSDCPFRGLLSSLA